MTAHNKAKKGDIAKTVLMPGDPLRAKWIAETFLTDYRLVNDVRGMFAFTGKYNNTNVTVMGHGMGIPSIGIYSYELFSEYDVETIIRIGSAGSYTKEINIGDLILANEAYSTSTYAKNIGIPLDNDVIRGNDELNSLILSVAKENNIPIFSGRVHSSDVFYGNKSSLEEIINMSKSCVVEMEAFGLFANAIKLNKKAATLLTCSDSLITHESMSSYDRQTKFINMVKLALKVVEKI